MLVVLLIASFAVGCAAAPADRPAVREDGVQLSVLHFPPRRRDVAMPVTDNAGLWLTDAVSVNGRRAGWFVVDTGAGMSVLDRAAARELGVTDTPPWKSWSEGRADQATTVPASPPDGAYRIARLDVAGVSLSNHVIGVLDLRMVSDKLGRRVAGVLGGDVWGATPFTLDGPRRRVVLHRRESFRPPAGTSAHRLVVRRPVTTGSYLAANPAAGQPVVTARIDGVPTSVVLDSASGVPLTLEPRFVAEHPQFVDAAAPPVARAAGAAGSRGLSGRLLVPAHARTVEAMGATFHCDPGAVLALRAAGGADASPDDARGCIVGMPFLLHGRLTFDYPRRRIWAKWSTR